jgi:hypothetical protein
MRRLAALLASLLLTLPLPGAAARIDPWPLPVPGSAAQPQLMATDTDLLLSWIETDGDGHRLRFARDAGRGFDAPRDIARGTRWFVNWADFPAMAALPDGRLAAFVLRKSTDAPYAYDLLLTRSDDGERWSTPAPVHDDATATEHGFAALWPWGERGLGIAWLDGRRTGGGGHGGHGHDGAMTLRAASFDHGEKRSEWELDARTCDCCQTDAAVSEGGPVLVYRDRSQAEIRDVAIVRWRDGAWTAPQLVHADRWFMPACPINGPAVAARGSDVYVAWYTVAGDTPVLRLAQSRDDGATFAPPIELARGNEVLGRVDLAVDDQALFVSWLSEDEKGQTLWLARRARSTDAAAPNVDVARLARGRGTGFPRLALRDGVAHLVWTDIVDKHPQLRGARVIFSE